MNLLPYYEIQRCLDDRIKKDHEIPDDVLELKIIAFKVELGELANSNRFFKFWSNKSSDEREVVLEEFCDGIHFLLSIAIERGWDRFVKEVKASRFDKQHKSLGELFNDLFQSGLNSCGEWARMFRYYLAIGDQLGFSEEDIQIAYVKKNEKNHARQTEGY
ncbi:dUTP diphosphatase [Rossellomorea aquimaris]|uniref:dUTP diphosphatase n=1 Tax=Rossellomorea aquimaris TaxID=189382 RepID=UPI0011E8E59D|nr:dUTP diphosphatase [Rossellomorea aquimaris]TYS91916.1 dUTPase [Rossellomorea aquimaris]